MIHPKHFMLVGALPAALLALSALSESSRHPPSRLESSRQGQLSDVQAASWRCAAASAPRQAGLSAPQAPQALQALQTPQASRALWRWSFGRSSSPQGSLPLGQGSDGSPLAMRIHHEPEHALALRAQAAWGASAQALALAPSSPVLEAIDARGHARWLHAPRARDVPQALAFERVAVAPSPRGHLLALYHHARRPGGELTKLDAATGEVRWRVRFAGLDDATRASAMQLEVRDGVIHVYALESSRAYVLTLDEASGELRRRQEVPLALARATAPLVQPGDAPWIRDAPRAQTAGLSVHDEVTGRLRWRMGFAHARRTPVALGPRQGVLASYDPDGAAAIVYMLDAQTGELRWAQRVELDASRVASPASTLRVAVALEGQGALVRVELEHGDERLQQVLDGPTGAPLAHITYPHGS